MGLMRSILLWGSRSKVLRETLPRFRFIRAAVDRFMPGEEIEDALDAAESLKSKGFMTVVTHLGENLTLESEANGVAQHYLKVLDLIRQRGLDCHVSLKLTQLGLYLDEDLCYRHLVSLVRRAKEVDNFVWIDMESSPYVDRTLDMFRRLRAEFSNVGVCLQSYLYRTANDIDDLLPLAPSIRLVKGTYAEPKRVAYTSKKDVDDSFFVLARQLLTAAKSDGMIIGVATHDLDLIQRIDRSMSDDSIGRQRYEVQMLYGIRRETQSELVNQGFRVRVLVSYGSFWFPWYMRRLAERPANVWFVLKNIFAR